MTVSLLQRVSERLAADHLIIRGDRVIVGVSGGADSVALLHVLVGLQTPLQLTLGALHVDHQLRPESAADAAFVQALCRRLRVPVLIERHDVSARCRAERWSLEDGARRIRYQCFVTAATQRSANVIALAHTADDQAETVLMRLLRGSGLTGLSGIPRTRALDGTRLVRPLLDVWRQDILQYLRQHRLSFREDASNRDVQFTRNRIRHELLPLLEQGYNPQIKAALVQLAEQCRSDNASVESLASRHWKRVAKIAPSGEVALTLRPLSRQSGAVQRSLVRRAVRHIRGDLLEFEYRHWQEIERLVSGGPTGAIAHLPGGVRVRRRPDRLEFHRV